MVPGVAPDVAMPDGLTTRRATALVARPAHPDQGRDGILYLCLPTGRLPTGAVWTSINRDFFSHNREFFAGIKDLTP